MSAQPVDVLAVMADSASDARAALTRAKRRGHFIYTEGYLRALEEVADAAESSINRVADLIAALQGVISVADRDTDEFNRARRALAACGVKS